ncbi:MAG: hypothetical protein Q9214_002503 [Letrouitia sp. 1 TL-2023]
MFRKKPNIKALSPLRSSDRRKIAEQIIASFDIELHADHENNVVATEGSHDGHATVPTSLGALRNSLVPENALSARFTTTTGPDLTQVSGIVYVGAHPGEEQRVLWFKFEDRLIPTVYTLWKHPGIVPLLHTSDSVLQRLKGGADLMTPGLSRGPPFSSRATKGSVVAIASLERPSVPEVVGVCEIDVASLQKVQGVKGHAVRGQHWSGDELWAWSQGGKPGGNVPDVVEGWDASCPTSTPEEKVKNLTIGELSDDGEEGGVSLSQTTGDNIMGKGRNSFVEGEEAAPLEEAKLKGKEFSTKEIDDIFWNAFLFGLFQQRNNHKQDPHHGLDFPLNQSSIISSLVLPFLPITDSDQTHSLNIKKTSWKNVKKFIKAFDKAKILKSKERDGGECVVLDVDFEDPAITNFVPYKLPKKENASVESSGPSRSNITASNSSSKDDTIGQKLSLISLYRPKDSVYPIFEASSSSVKSFYLPTELRSIVTSYIESESLISDDDKRFIQINPIIANAIFDGRSAVDKEALAQGRCRREALFERVQDKCSPFWAILRNHQTREAVKAQAGSAPKIQITLETRSGNKTATKVAGFEVFHVRSQPLADELQKTCASSTSVNQQAGSSPKSPVMEIMIQGPQKDAVLKALEKRGVRRTWVEVRDKTKGKKK